MPQLTPAEEAKQLVDKYRTYVVMWAGGTEVSNENVKQCALIAVDEMLKEANGDGFSWNINCYWDGEKYIPHKEWKERLEQIKQQIQSI